MDTTIRDGITSEEAWLLAASDVLDVTATVLDQLSPAARDEITQIIAREIPDYTDSDDLARRARAAVDHIDYTN